MSHRPIRVEITIAADLETVWRLTQDPALHARWDARFSRISPLADVEDERPARFTYERRMPGLTIRGTGISLGSRVGADGARTSALRFTTSDRRSPLRDGRGFWRYEPVDGGTRFITGYDYVPGWGLLLDRVARPVVAWMTAYSFARLRRWAENGEPPEAWPVWRALLDRRRDRPRASDCTWSIGRQTAMADAPRALAALEAP